MTFSTDYLVVGAGLTGATIARQLHDAGREVVVIDRRNHSGGNVYDSIQSGFRVHTYGPHYFRTSSRVIWEWANRFGAFRPFEARVLTDVGGGILMQWPPSASCLEQMAGKGWAPEFTGKPANLEEACLAMMPRAAYELFVEQYNEKQWGIHSRDLSPSLARRFSVRAPGETRLTPAAKYQGLPVDGYAAWTANMLEGIPVMHNCDYEEVRRTLTVRRKTIYTGPIDEYFGFRLGRLKYRGQIRTHKLSIQSRYQSCVQVNNPLHSGGPHIRTIDWRHVTEPEIASRLRNSFVTTETPFTPDNPNDYEYPFPDKLNARLYAEYRKMARCVEPRVLFAGRLGTFQYLDMDQAIAKAMAMRGKVFADESSSWTGNASCAKPESQNPPDASKPSPKPESSQPSGTKRPEASPLAPREATPASPQPSPASRSNSAKAALRADLQAAIAEAGDNHTAGSRLPLQCRLALDAAIAVILDRYHVEDVLLPGVGRDG